ncbi:hypothetical protein DC915_RS02460 [Vibrio parahaemolyticus]|nr:hypothetical protein [Vibrio parahaemolyticus]EJG0009839.1 hypothetical protein [Vibrio parahaemolyticus]
MKRTTLEALASAYVLKSLTDSSDKTMKEVSTFLGFVDDNQLNEWLKQILVPVFLDKYIEVLSDGKFSSLEVSVFIHEACCKYLVASSDWLQKSLKTDLASIDPSIIVDDAIACFHSKTI